MTDSSIYVGKLSFNEETVTRMPTMRLRWSKDGHLQQAVEVVTHRGLSLVESKTEWVPVPCEEP